MKYVFGVLLWLGISAQAFGMSIICAECGDPKDDYRNYGAFVYNQTKGAQSPGWNYWDQTWGVGLSTPVTIYNPTRDTYATVMIQRSWTQRGAISVVPFMILEPYWEIIVQSPTGIINTYQVLVGTLQLPLSPVQPAAPPAVKPSSQNTGGGSGGGDSGMGSASDFRFYDPFPIYRSGGGSTSSTSVWIFELYN